jgi:hypothetical protein
MEFDCEAYGPDSIEHCFVELAYGHCETAEECHSTMWTERVNLWVKLLLLEKAGDEVASAVLEGITGPEDLLGGASSRSR